MKRAVIILLILISGLYGCKKDKTTRTSGTDTIDNTLYGTGPYYAYGFSFQSASKISSLLNPGPDIVIYVNIDNPDHRLTFQANNLRASFFKVGEYPDEASAISAFNNLTTVGAYQWVEMADPVNPNQVWVYRSGGEQYTKIRIISTVNELRDNVPYGECTFEWLYQPDGSLTFGSR
jgi:hypothetical protein